VALLLVKPLAAAPIDNTGIADAQERFFQSMLNSDLGGVKIFIKQRPKMLLEAG
jgi:hypothetical protein